MGQNTLDELAILVVDDELLILDTLEVVFRRHGYTPYCSLNGNGALELLRMHRFRVIFTDLRMPEMDGMELCRCMKEHDPDASVYALSAYVDAFTDEEFNEAGFADRFRKPFDIMALIKACEDGFARIASKDREKGVGNDPRRKYHRLVLPDKVIASILRSEKDPSLLGKTLDCSDCTVSERGMEIVVNGEVGVSTDVQLHVCVSGNPTSYFMDGIVRWTSRYPTSELGKVRTRAGVQFLPSSRDLKTWSQFISQPALKKHLAPSQGYTE
jgi:CheY-like chemotaxis protein